MIRVLTNLEAEHDVIYHRIPAGSYVNDTGRQIRFSNGQQMMEIQDENSKITIWQQMESPFQDEDVPITYQRDDNGDKYDIQVRTDYANRLLVACITAPNGRSYWLGQHEVPEGKAYLFRHFGCTNEFRLEVMPDSLDAYQGTQWLFHAKAVWPTNAIPPNTNPCPDIAIAPIPTNATPRTGGQRTAMARSLWRRHLVEEGYQQRGHRSPAWDRDAEALLDGFLKNYVHAWQGIRDDGKRLALSQKIIDKGCRDPYVRFVHAYNLDKCRKSEEAQQIFAELREEFAAADMPNSFMLFITHFMSRGDRKTYSPHRESFVLFFEKTATDGSFQGEEIRYVFPKLLSQILYWGGLSQNEYEQVQAVMNQNALLDPWLKEMYWADHAVRYVVPPNKSRRSDYIAYQYSAWAKYAEDLESAKKHYQNAIDIHPDWPESYEPMIELASYSPTCSKEETRAWFDRVIACQFDYLDAYLSLIDAWSPEYGGSLEQLVDLGVAFADTQRFDTQVPDYIYRTLEKVGEYTGDMHALLDRPEVADALIRTAATYAERDTYRTRNLTRAAVMSWFYGDYHGAGEFLSMLPPKTPLNRRIMETFHTTEKELLADVKLHTGRSTGRLNEDGALAFTLRQRQFLEAVEKQLASGEWTPLMKANSLDGWTLRYGKVVTTTNDTVEAQDNNRRFQLRGHMDLGDTYEYAVDFDFEIPDYDARFGIGMGTYNSPPPFGGAGICDIELEPSYRKEKGLYYPSVNIKSRYKKYFPKPGRNTLLLRANGTRGEIYLNGELIEVKQYRVVPGESVNPYIFTPPMFRWENLPAAWVRYGNMRARRLAPGTRLDSLPPPREIPSPIWQEKAREAGDQMSATEERGVSSEATMETTQVIEERVLTVRNLEANEEPIWIDILPPDSDSKEWRIAWTYHESILEGGATAAQMNETSFTLMHSTNLIHGFSPVKTNLRTNQIAIPSGDNMGFYYIRKED